MNMMNHKCVSFAGSALDDLRDFNYDDDNDDSNIDMIDIIELE